MYALRRNLPLLVLLVLLTACAQEPIPSENPGPSPVDPGIEETQEEETEEVVEPRRLDRLYPNPLDLTYSETPSDSGYYARLDVGEGLADQETAAWLQKQIDTTYEDLRGADPPPYRGIHVYLDPGEEAVGESLYVNESFNHNGLLSLIFNHDLTFRDDRYVSELVAETYDLSNRRTLGLADLFSNGEAEVLAYFDRLITDRLVKDAAWVESEGDGFYWYGDKLRLATRFDGITADQPFYLDRTGITLVFDHRTPAFATGWHPEYATGFHPAYLQIPYRELSTTLTFIDPFLSPEPALFTQAEPLLPELIVSDAMNMDGAVLSETRDGIPLYMEARFPETLPPGVEAEIERLITPDEALLSHLREMARQASGEPSYHHYLWVNRWGSFLSLQRTIDLYDGMNWESHALYRIYSEEGTPMTPETLFTDPGVVMRDHLIPALEREMGMAGVGQTPAPEAIMEDVTYGLGAQEIYMATGPLDLENGGISSLRFQVTFEELGLDQLKFLEP